MEIKDDKDELRYEYAKLILDDKSIYEGECIKGIGTGYGKRTYKDGKIEVGKFSYNELNGYGKRVHKNGQVEEGTFDNGLYIKKQKKKLIDIKNIFKRYR